MTDTEKIKNLHNSARKAAEDWIPFKPVVYSSSFFIDGSWVKVTIELDTSRNSISMTHLRERLERVLGADR